MTVVTIATDSRRTTMRVPTKQDLLADPSTPRWAKELLEVSGRIDPLDYINALETLLAEARRRIKLPPGVSRIAIETRGSSEFWEDEY